MYLTSKLRSHVLVVFVIVFVVTVDYNPKGRKMQGISFYVLLSFKKLNIPKNIKDKPNYTLIER